MCSRSWSVKMAARKNNVLTESELKRVLEDSGSDFDDFFCWKIVLKVKVK
jgi:hypothetical protein